MSSRTAASRSTRARPPQPPLLRHLESPHPGLPLAREVASFPTRTHLPPPALLPAGQEDAAQFGPATSAAVSLLLSDKRQWWEAAVRELRSLALAAAKAPKAQVRLGFRVFLAAR